MTNLGRHSRKFHVLDEGLRALISYSKYPGTPLDIRRSAVSIREETSSQYEEITTMLPRLYSVNL